MNGQNSFLNDLRLEDASGFKRFARLNRPDFEYLNKELGNTISGTSNYTLRADEKFLVTLLFSATGDLFSSLEYLFKISKQAISDFVPTVCIAIHEALTDYIKVIIYSRSLYIFKKVNSQAINNLKGMKIKKC